MGFEKWALKNGPGSVGDSAKFFSKYYNRLHAENPYAPWSDHFLVMYVDRYNTNMRFDPKNKRGGSLNLDFPGRIHNIINSTQGDLPVFIFLVTKMEDPNKQDVYYRSHKLLCLSLEVIREVVVSLAPSRVIFDNEKLLRNAQQICVDYFV